MVTLLALAVGFFGGVVFAVFKSDSNIPGQSAPMQAQPQAAAPVVDETSAMDETPQGSAGGADAGNDEISEGEFEALLDELHGPGKHGGVPADATTDSMSKSALDMAGGEDISEAEFEALLDRLHGKGRHGGVPGATAASDSASDDAAAAREFR